MDKVYKELVKYLEDLKELHVASMVSKIHAVERKLLEAGCFYQSIQCLCK